MARIAVVFKRLGPYHHARLRAFGRVVEEGKTGFIIPPRDPQALVEAIMRFVRNRALSSEMSPKCREAAAVFSIDAYGQHLVEIIENSQIHRNT